MEKQGNFPNKKKTEIHDFLARKREILLIPLASENSERASRQRKKTVSGHRQSRPEH